MPYKIVEGENNSVRIEVRERRLLAAGDLRAGAQGDEGHRRAVPRPAGDQGGDHRPRLLQRQPAPGHQGRRPHRRARGAAHPQRAHRRGAGLRLRPRRQPAGGDLRPRRRHLRRLDPRDRQGRLRGAGHRRRHLPRRRRLRRPDHDLAGRRLPGPDPARPPAEQVLPADAEGGRGAGEDRRRPERHRGHRLREHLPGHRGQGAGPPADAGHRPVQPDGDGPGAAHLQGLRRGAAERAAHRRRRRRGHPGRRPDPAAHRPQLGEALLPEATRWRASTPTRWWRWARRCRPTRCSTRATETFLVDVTPLTPAHRHRGRLHREDHREEHPGAHRPVEDLHHQPRRPGAGEDPRLPGRVEQGRRVRDAGRVRVRRLPRRATAAR